MQADYTGPRALLSIIAALGWLGILAGIGLLAWGFGQRDSIALIATGLSTTISGLVTVALTSVGKAMFDVAENTGQMVQTLRSQHFPPVAPSFTSAAPAIAAADDIAQTYRGEHILKRPGGFMARGRVFGEIEDAREWIDQHNR
jgi:hypothetical protein